MGRSLKSRIEYLTLLQSIEVLLPSEFGREVLKIENRFILRSRYMGKK